MRWLEGLKRRAGSLRTETYALYLAARDPRTPWYARLLVAGIVAYAISPIDLIPDFIPVLGYLDDLILVPAGIALAVRLVPPAVLDECRVRSREAFGHGRPVSRIAGALVLGVWVAAAALLMVWAIRAFQNME